jgi:hypothetical protein
MKRILLIVLLVLLMSAAWPFVPGNIQETLITFINQIRPTETAVVVEITPSPEMSEIAPTEPVVFPTATFIPTTTSQGYPAPLVETQEISPPQVTEVATFTPTEIPTATPTATSIFENLKPLTGDEVVPFSLQSVSPVYLSNFANPEAGCNWMGIAGQVFDENQLPVDGLVVVIEGLVDGNKIESLGFTGLSAAYGPAGYEVVLGDKSVPGEFWLQLFDQDGNPLSDIYAFETPGGCEQNLGILNFTFKINEVGKFIPSIEQ